MTMDPVDKRYHTAGIARVLVGLGLMPLTLMWMVGEVASSIGPESGLAVTMTGYVTVLLALVCSVVSGGLSLLGRRPERLARALRVELWGWRLFTVGIALALLGNWVRAPERIAHHREEERLSHIPVVVAVAARDIEPGEVITTGDVQRHEVSRRLLAEPVVAAPDPIGRRAVSRALAGELIHPAQVEAAGGPVRWRGVPPDRRWLTVLVPPGTGERPPEVDVVRPSTPPCAVARSVPAQWGERVAQLEVSLDAAPAVQEAVSRPGVRLTPPGEVDPCAP